MISANGGLPAHRYTPQVTEGWPRGSEPASPRGKVQSATGQWYDVHADMFHTDNITEGARQGDQCWRCTKEAGQVPWPVLQMTAWALPNATMRTTDARGQWWGPVLRLPKEVQEDEEAQGKAECWWGEE